MSFGEGVDGYRLGADPDAEVDLFAGRGDDLAAAHDEGAVGLRAGGVGGERHGLSEYWKAQPCCQQACEGSQAVDS